MHASIHKQSPCRWLLGVYCSLTALISPAVMAGATVSLVDESPNATVLRITVPSPKLEVVDSPAGEFTRFSQRERGQGGAGQSDTGAPELPIVGFPLALPVDLEKTPDIEVKPEGTPHLMEARLFPIQPPDAAQRYKPELPRFEFNLDVWERGVREPGASLGALALFKGDANVESFRFLPYGYSPTRQRLSWYDSYLVTIRHAAGPCFFIDALLDRKNRASFDSVDTFIQNLPLPVVRYAINQRALTRVCPPQVIFPNLSGVRYLIISHPNFLAAANDLRNHKATLGISTEVVSTQTITGAGAFATAPQIRAWLENYWNTHLVKPKWVLLLGDAEFIPTRYDLPNSSDTARNAGDMWYGQFLPGGGATTIPPFGIGRFPVDTLAQANTMVSKVLAFENFPPSNPVVGNDFYNRLTFAAEFQGSGATDERWFAETAEIVRNHALGLGYAVERIYGATALSNPTRWRGGALIPASLRKPVFPWNGSAAGINTAVNQGTALLFHRDHGWWDGWGTPSYDISDLAGISVTNNEFPVVFSVNCASGVFDGESVDLPANIVGGGYMSAAQETSTWWSENFVRKSDGALAVIGDTRSSSTIDNNHLTFGLFDAIFPGLVPGFGPATAVRRLGDLLNHAKGFVAAVDAGAAANLHPLDVGGVVPGVSGLRQELNIYNLLGDPTVKLRTSPPWQFPIVNIVLEAGVARIRVPIEPCLNCPPDLPRPELITAVAFDPKTGRVIGREVVNGDGEANIDIGKFEGNFWVRVGSGDGASQQAALVETDADRDGVPDSREDRKAHV